jgi:tRNA(adenine34) deaminase
MTTPDSAVGLALEVAQDGLRASELPIGAVVLAGDRVVGRAHTKERELGRRIVHADLLAMIQADEDSRSAAPTRSSSSP